MTKVGEAANERVQGRKRKTRKLEREQAERDVEWLMQHPQFRRFCFRILGSTGVLKASRSSLVGHAHAAFREGQQAVGIALMNTLCSVTPAEFAQMVGDAKRKEARSKPAEPRETEDDDDDTE